MILTILHCIVVLISTSQRVLAYCDNRKIYDTLAAEIIDAVNNLSKHEYANFVVKYLLEHGSQAHRSAMVKKFAGRVVAMSYQKYASNVIEACLSFGCDEDRRLITREIIDDDAGQHCLDMMINPYANYVIQKMVLMAEEEQVRLLVDVASRNVAYLRRYSHGQHVLAAMERFLSAKGTYLVLSVVLFLSYSMQRH